MPSFSSSSSTRSALSGTRSLPDVLTIAAFRWSFKRASLKLKRANGRSPVLAREFEIKVAPPKRLRLGIEGLFDQFIEKSGRLYIRLQAKKHLADGAGRCFLPPCLAVPKRGHRLHTTIDGGRASPVGRDTHALAQFIPDRYLVEGQSIAIQ